MPYSRTRSPSNGVAFDKTRDTKRNNLFLILWTPWGDENDEFSMGPNINIYIWDLVLNASGQQYE